MVLNAACDRPDRDNNQHPYASWRKLEVTARSLASDRVQGGCGSHVRQEADLQHVEQEVLVVDTVNSVQEQNHGGLVVWDKTG